MLLFHLQVETSLGYFHNLTDTKKYIFTNNLVTYNREIQGLRLSGGEKGNTKITSKESERKAEIISLQTTQTMHLFDQYSLKKTSFPKGTVLCEEHKTERRLEVHPLHDQKSTIHQ